MTLLVKTLVAVAVGTVLATAALAQDARDARGPSPFVVPIVNEPAPRLIVDRVGHLHVTVDDLPWRWGDFSDSNTIVVVGLPPGPHKVLIKLADPEPRVFTGQAVTFTVPGPTR